MLGNLLKGDVVHAYLGYNIVAIREQIVTIASIIKNYRERLILDN
jgi:hypothetical protein